MFLGAVCSGSDGVPREVDQQGFADGPDRANHSMPHRLDPPPVAGERTRLPERQVQTPMGGQREGLEGGAGLGEIESGGQAVAGDDSSLGIRRGAVQDDQPVEVGRFAPRRMAEQAGGGRKSPLRDG